MAVGDIYQAFVTFDKSQAGKVRYLVEIGKDGLAFVLLNTITSQYQSKSDFIKLQYYPIQDWLKAGLQKPSFIDIKSVHSFELSALMQQAKYIGQLTFQDVQNLAVFIKSYRTRLENLLK